MNAPPRAILEIAWGPLGSRRAVVAPGTEIQVGRAAPADLVVPHDQKLAGLHFAFAWDGARGQVRDLDTASGTWLDGERIPGAASVGPGAWIRAGDTMFRLQREGAADRPLPEDSPALAARKGAALAALRAEPAPLFALLDAARDPRILAILRASVEAQGSLYDGLQGQLLAEVAPYLVALPPGSPLLDRLVGEGWEKSWGVYVTSPRPFIEVRRHFRRILMVDMEAENKKAPRAYFRFYDPRVLRDFLPLTSPRQREEVFGDVEAFVLEGAAGEVQRWVKA